MWKQSRIKSQRMLGAIITVGLMIFRLLWSLFSNIPRNSSNGIGFILALLENERKYRWSPKNFPCLSQNKSTPWTSCTIYNVPSLNIQEIYMFGNSIHPTSSLTLTLKSFRGCVRLLFGDVFYGRVSVNAFFTSTSSVTLQQDPVRNERPDCGMNTMRIKR